MKIGLVCRHYSPRKGGLERYTISLSRKLLEQGHEVHVFANTWEAPPAVHLHPVFVVPFSLPLKTLSFAFFSALSLNKTPLDVVHSMERVYRQDIFRASDGVVPVQLLQRYPNPWVRRIRAWGPRRLALRYLEKRIFQGKGSKVIMANSHLVRNQIMEFYRVPSDRIRVIYNGLATERFCPQVKNRYRRAVRHAQGIREHEMVLLFVSNDHKRKGLAYLLRAVLSLKGRQIRVMVIGRDKDASYRRWAARTSLTSQVLFLGPRKQIEKYYAGADVLVLPTRYDAFSNVCLEAMGCGLPVITTASNGASELIQDGEEGFVLRTWDPSELARRITALEATGRRKSMGESAARKAGLFTMDRHVREVIALYKELKGPKLSSARFSED